MAIVRVREAFTTYDKTQKALRSYCPGDLISSDDSVVKGKEHLFEPVEVAAARTSGVEEATAEPGAKRSVSTTKPVYGATHPPEAGEQATKRRGRPKKAAESTEVEE